jgi:uncharacterized circularly permuted ATP-grasp superfamily protein
VEQALDPATLVHAYDPGDGYDEAFAAPGEPRAHYRGLLDSLAGCDLERLAASVAEDVDAMGMEFRTARGAQAFPIDPLPRILPAQEWERLEQGLVQRTQALDAFLADIHAERRIVREGVVPERAIDALEAREPDARAIAAAGGVRASVAGFDVVRGDDGDLRVLEDNLRTPSGLAYLAGARTTLDLRLPLAPPSERAPLRHRELLASTLRAAAPDTADDPTIILLSDGSGNSAWWEHWRLARALGVPLVAPPQLSQRGGRLYARVGERGRTVPVDVVYRRTDEDHLRGSSGNPTWLGELLIEPLRRGTLGTVNGFGTGLADDKLIHAYVEDMVRFYLGEDPLVCSVVTYDPGEDDVREQVLDRLDEMVVKPRGGSGGEGVVVCPHAKKQDVERARERLIRRPEAYVVQETIALSTHPTVVGDRIEPRHVDLRAFAFHTEDGVQVLAAGLTRVALDAGALVVNSSRNGGGKDTWMLT